MTHTQPTRDIYHQITDRVVTAIEAGAPTFEMPWHHPVARLRPVNIASGKPYRGVNIVALWVAQLSRGFRTSLWGTYKQWQAHGVQVRKGEKASLVVFYQEMAREVENAATGEIALRKFAVARASCVFNADQVDGYTIPKVPVLADQTEVSEHAEQFVAASGARVVHGAGSAYYHPSTDTIHMPQRALFLGSSTSTPTEAYYATLFHELTHWSGHESRLNRLFGQRFGEHAYAMEELVAELGAAFLCADLGITLEPRPDHAAYLAYWLTVLRADKRALFTAASRASEAAEFLTQLTAQALREVA